MSSTPLAGMAKGMGGVPIADRLQFDFAPVRVGAAVYGWWWLTQLRNIHAAISRRIRQAD